ncbi:MAG: patatin-like phospholipase family protein [Pseudomonadota bacterium]
MPDRPDIAMVLSGGGSKGAFQVGVLDELVTRRGLNVDLYAGISTGAIQALGAAADRIGDLRRVWEDIRSDRDIYKKRFLGLVGAVIGGADSQYDATPVRRKIRAFHDPAALAAAGKGLLVGAVSLNSGELRYVDETNPAIAEWVIASAAVPATYQPLITSDGDKWVDGGVRDITPLGAVIARRPKAILIVLASPSGEGAGRKSKSYDNLLEIALRSVGILTNEVFENDIGQATRINAILDAATRQRALLTAEGLSVDAIARSMAPVDAIINRFRDVPILTIQPDLDFDLPSSTSFKPDEIARTIAHGEAVAARPETQAAIADWRARAGV